MFYFISDLHFGHNKDFVYKARGFNTVEEMNEKILENINSRVGKDDTLFVLGDIYMTGEENAEYFKRINCENIHIILGNHDTHNKVMNLFGTGKITDVSYADVIKWKKYSFYLSHYPTITTKESKHLSTSLINLFGHTHQTEKFYITETGKVIPWMYNVGCDAHNCMPVSIEEIIADCRIEFQKYAAERDKNKKEEENGNLCNERYPRSEEAL